MGGPGATVVVVAAIVVGVVGVGVLLLEGIVGVL